jgi:hypothetical protein
MPNIASKKRVRTTASALPSTRRARPGARLIRKVEEATPPATRRPPWPLEGRRAGNHAAQPSVFKNGAESRASSGSQNCQNNERIGFQVQIGARGKSAFICPWPRPETATFRACNTDDLTAMTDPKVWANKHFPRTCHNHLAKVTKAKNFSNQEVCSQFIPLWARAAWTYLNQRMGAGVGYAED